MVASYKVGQLVWFNPRKTLKRVTRVMSKAGEGKYLLEGVVGVVSSSSICLPEHAMFKEAEKLDK